MTNAGNSATSALASLNDFKGRYFGSQSSNPTTDLLGNAVNAGDLYFNSTAAELVYTSGATWVAAYLPAAAYEVVSAKGAANGYAGLDGSGKVPSAPCPRS